MKISDALHVRRSRRFYEKTPLTEGEKEKLTGAIQRCNAMSGLHIQLISENAKAFDGFLKSYGIFKNVSNYIALVGKDDNLSREKLGYYGEKLVLLATVMGLGTCWVGGTFDKKSCDFERGDGDILHAVITIGNVEKKLSPREKLVVGLSHIGGGKNKISDTAADAPLWFRSGIEAVLKAPSALNRRPVKITWDDNEVRAEAKGNNPFDYIYLGIAKLHFEIGAFGGEWEWGSGGMFNRR